MSPAPALIIAYGVVALLLAITSAIALVRGAESAPSALRRVAAWWAIFAVVGGAILLGWRATWLVFAFISFFALREFLTLAPTRREDRLVVLWIYGSILISYWSIWIDVYPYFLVIVPIYVFVITAFLMALTGRAEGFLATAGIMHWGVIACVYNLGHAAFLARTPAAEAGASGAAGLVFFLIVATAVADVSQHMADRMIGKRRIGAGMHGQATWEGLAASVLVTCAFFLIAAPYFSPLDLWSGLLVGALLPLWAAAGRLTMSAVKRDLGVANSSLLIPGAGGALDRVASLTFTAPWYFHMHAMFALERF